MAKEKQEYTSIEELLYEEVVYESYLRALTDDFSVIDRVNHEERKDGKYGKN